MTWNTLHNVSQIENNYFSAMETTCSDSCVNDIFWVFSVVLMVKKIQVVVNGNAGLMARARWQDFLSWPIDGWTKSAIGLSHVQLQETTHWRALCWSTGLFCSKIKLMPQFQWWKAASDFRQYLMSWQKDLGRGSGIHSLTQPLMSELGPLCSTFWTSNARKYVGGWNSGKLRVPHPPLVQKHHVCAWQCG